MAANVPDLKQKEPNTVLASFIGLVQSIFAGVSDKMVTGLYRMQKVLLQSLMPEGINKRHADRFPTTLKAHREIFGLEAELVIRAACPKCCKTFAADAKGLYPKTCNWREFNEGEVCGEQLCKRRQGCDGRSHLVPIKPFVMQDFAAFKAQLLRRKGIENLLELAMIMKNRDLLETVMDGNGVREMTGPDDAPFLTGVNNPELRTVWGYSMDHFQRNGNKIGSRKYGNGVQALDCKSLPPCVALRPENIFVAAIMPGPHEPHGEQINRYLEPVIEQLNQSYIHGDYYTKTYKYPEGRSERSIVGVIISDTVASRQLSGLPHYSRGGEFCMFDHQEKKDLRDTDTKAWKRRTVQEMRADIERWERAQTRAQRDAIFKETGIRPSALWNLHYFDPSMLVVDGMHNLFEGVVKHHFIKILGFHEEKTRKQNRRLVTALDIQKVTRLFETGASNKKLEKDTRLDVLQALIDARSIPSGKVRKKDAIPLLKVRGLTMVSI
jgi:hypothetical protein